MKATATISGGTKTKIVLGDMLKKLGRGSFVNVGFLESAKYPATVHKPNQGGLPVAMVAFWMEYGTSKTPARSFFRTMIADNKAEWSPLFTRALKATRYDAAAALKIMGVEISEELRDSIRSGDFTPLSPVTLMLRKMADDDPSLVINGAAVAEARARVAAGETGATGDRSNPLLDTQHMAESVDFEVVNGEGNQA